MALKVLMMGTGEFALPTLQTLADSEHDVVGLVTQPDRVLRGKHVHPHPMKELAVDRGIAVFQPDNVNAPASLQTLRDFGADIFVVAAYGQILSAELLGIPRLGAVNLHGSLLPKYRGAAPIQYAVWCGEAETGVTIFQIEPKLDAGPMYGSVATPIGPQDTSRDVHDRLAGLAAPLTLEVLSQLEAGTATGTMQDTQGVTRAPKIPKSAGLIDWTKMSREIDCHIRAMQPWPNPWTFLDGGDGSSKRILILRVEPISLSQREEAVPPGTILDSPAGTLHVRTADGALAVSLLQPEGKRAMSVEEFLRGTPLVAGAFFTNGLA